jgi:uncharacterized protein YqeY
MEPMTASPLRAALRDALTVAMKDRDRVATSALRSALAAIDNAEAVDVSLAPPEQPAVIAGGVVGLGAGEVTRRTITDDDVRAILRDAISEREAAAAQYDELSRHDDASRLRTEASVLAALVDGGAR